MGSQVDNLEEIIKKINDSGKKTEVKVTEADLSSEDSIETPPPPPNDGKLTRGKVKLGGNYIEDKQRRQTCFSKRKAGMFARMDDFMNLTGAQGMFVIASQTGYIYSYASSAFESFLSSDETKESINNCLVEHSDEDSKFSNSFHFCALNSPTIDKKKAKKDEAAPPPKKAKKGDLSEQNKPFDMHEFIRTFTNNRQQGESDLPKEEPVGNDEAKKPPADDDELTYPIEIAKTWHPPKE